MVGTPTYTSFAARRRKKSSPAFASFSLFARNTPVDASSVPKRPPHLAMCPARSSAAHVSRNASDSAVKNWHPWSNTRGGSCVVGRDEDARPPRPLDPWSMSSTTGPSRSTAFAIDAAQLRPATPAPMIATGARPSPDIKGCAVPWTQRRAARCVMRSERKREKENPTPEIRFRVTASATAAAVSRRRVPRATRETFPRTRATTT